MLFYARSTSAIDTPVERCRERQQGRPLILQKPQPQNLLQTEKVREIVSLIFLLPSPLPVRGPSATSVLSQQNLLLPMTAFLEVSSAQQPAEEKLSRTQETFVPGGRASI